MERVSRQSLQAQGFGCVVWTQSGKGGGSLWLTLGYLVLPNRALSDIVGVIEVTQAPEVSDEHAAPYRFERPGRAASYCIAWSRRDHHWATAEYALDELGRRQDMEDADQRVPELFTALCDAGVLREDVLNRYAPFLAEKVFTEAAASGILQRQRLP